MANGMYQEDAENELSKMARSPRATPRMLPPGAIRGAGEALRDRAYQIHLKEAESEGYEPDTYEVFLRKQAKR